MKRLWKNELSRIIVSFLILVGLMASVAVMPVLTHVFGKEVVITAGAYNPSDVFRGSHLRLFYNIQEISIDSMDASLQALFEDDDYSIVQRTLQGQRIYVTFKETPNGFMVDQASRQRPNTPYYVRAEVNYVLFDWNTREIPDTNFEPTGVLKGIHVTYPADRYYMSRSETENLLQALRDQDAIAHVKIWRGHMVLSRIESE